LSEYLLPFLVILGVNLMPAFGPPTWSIIVLFSLNSNLPVMTLVPVGALAAATGRLALAYGFRRLGGYLPAKYRRNLGAARAALEARRRNMILGLGLFALSPLPSAQLFAAAGLAGIRLLGFTAAFFAGRLISYSIYAWSARGIRESRVGDLFADMFSSPWGILLQIAMIALVVLLVRLDWGKLLQRTGGPAGPGEEPDRR